MSSTSEQAWQKADEARASREEAGAPATPEAALRRRAVLLNFLTPGLGFAYLGRSRLGWLTFAGFPIWGLAMPLGAWIIPVGFVGLLAQGLYPLFLRMGPPRDDLGRQFGLRLLFGTTIVAALYGFWGGNYKIPSGAMLPTLEVGDHIYVAHFTHWRLSPERGEVIVFGYPPEPSKQFIKRVIGLAGDRVAVRNEVVYLNGKALVREIMPGPCSYDDKNEGLRPDSWEKHSCTAVRERLDGHVYTTILETGKSPAPDFPHAGEPPEFVVPPGHVFVLGDNRRNSSDSRVWGTVDLKLIRGTPKYVWWSNGPEGVRWPRMGQSIE